MRIIRIKNISGSVRTVCGKELAIDELYTIQDVELHNWESSEAVISEINSNNIQVYDANGAIVLKTDQLKHLYGEAPVNASVIETPPFAVPSYRTKFDATSSIITIPVNTPTTIDYQLTEERYVSGGEALITDAQFGDYVTAEINDKDGVIPQAYRAALCESHPTVANYIKKMWVPCCSTTTKIVINTYPLNAKVTAGLYLRVTYYPTNTGVDRKLGMTYYLTKKL